MIFITINYYCYITRRSLSRRISNIGIWNNIFNYISFAGVLYNSIVILVPGNGLSELLDSQSRETTVIIIFLLEHLILALKYLLSEIIPLKPEWISLRLKNERRSRTLAEEGISHKYHRTKKLLKENYKEKFGKELGEENLKDDFEEDNDVRHVFDNGYEIKDAYLRSKWKGDLGCEFPLLKVD